MTDASCLHCSSAVPAKYRFCGMCGTPVGASAPSTATAVYPQSEADIHASNGPSLFKRYRGPIWVGGLGTVLFIAGAGVATAIFSAVQVEAAPALLLDIFRPFVEEQVDGTIAEGVTKFGEDGQAKDASVLMLIGFIGGSLVAALGILLMLVGGAWGANRAMKTRKSGTVTVAAYTAPPAPIPPSFSAPPPPTYTQPPPPPPPAPPTFTRPGPPS